MKYKLLRPGMNKPIRKTSGAAGFDVYSPESMVLPPGGRYQLKLGIAFALDKGYAIMTSERSGHALNYGLVTIGNIIDSDYRGEISVILLNTSDRHVPISQGERVAQLVILRVFDKELEEVDELDETARGNGGFGSTGKVDPPNLELPI